MGCDIHCYTEALITINSKPTWRNVDNWRLNQYYLDGESDQYELKSIWDRRDYYLFAVLAGVRNYDGTIPIAEPRGLPTDVSDIVKRESDAYGIDGHSHSWLSLPEIIRYAKSNANTKASGLVTAEESAKLDALILPTLWCEGSSIPNLVRREWMMPNTSLTELIEALEERCRDEFWVFRQENLTDEHRAKIRIVFWFDN